MVRCPQKEHAVQLSIVIPVYNEEESLPLLVAEVREAIQPTGLSYELVCVDDGSRDRSLEVLRSLAEEDPSIVVLSFRRNFGQTAAMQAGLDYARGEIVALMDADLQNDPADIPPLSARAHRAGFNVEDNFLPLHCEKKPRWKTVYLGRDQTSG